MQELRDHFSSKEGSSSLCTLLSSLRRRPVMARPAEVVRLFVRQLELGKIREVVNMLPEKIVRLVGNAKLESIFFDDMAEVQERGGILRLEILGERTEDDTAEVDVSLCYRDGTSDTERVLLVKEKYEWKVDMSR
jgi:hypothetical protein